MHFQPQSLQQQHGLAVWHSLRTKAGMGCARQQAVLQAHMRRGEQPAAADSQECVQGTSRVAVGAQQKAAGCSDHHPNGELTS